ncbi:hypothetical protein FQA39_LY01662 [Lamprigera yunnana]|nr:hypothetical protein FQA39_LY01662 [Lamprigera yunnana]
MAPRRQHGQVQGLIGIDPEEAGVTRCCVPSGECLRAQQQQMNPNNNDPMLISLDDLRDTVRVTCNNDACNAGRYMHRECFDAWEQTVLAYLKTCGRARSWSERQRHQNLWTKKGYDLAFKACGCKCGRGHLKKDLDWMPPPPTSNIFGRIEEVETGKKKKRRNRNNSRPSLAINTYHPNSIESRGRAGSLSSSTGSSSPPATVSEPSISPVHGNLKKKSGFDFVDKCRIGGGANGIFTRRLDFSSFNALPPNRLNSYQIKEEKRNTGRIWEVGGRSVSHQKKLKKIPRTSNKKAEGKLELQEKTIIKDEDEEGEILLKPIASDPQKEENTRQRAVKMELAETKRLITEFKRDIKEDMEENKLEMDEILKK